MVYWRLYWLFIVWCLVLAASPVGAQPDQPAEPKDQDSQGPAAASDAMQQIARQARGSVVVITVEGRDGKRQAIGSGFVVAAEGLVATNLHVIGEARPIRVHTADSKAHRVIAIHASDRALDLAVIRIDTKDLPALPLGDPKSLRQGQPVVALGNPLGLQHSVVSGVVSGFREIDGRNMIQLAIPIEQGNSGGPVLDAEGRVQGILTMKSALTANLGFAVSVDDLKTLLARPNPVPMSRWLTIGALDSRQWTSLFGGRWRQRAGHILASDWGDGFGGRSLCLSQQAAPARPYELAVTVRLDDEAGAAGLVFCSDGDTRHYGFYPSHARLRLTRFEGPTPFTWEVLQERESAHYRPGDWNRLKVRLEQDRILCYVNDQLVIESADKGLAAGRVGLAKFRQTKADFKQFAVAGAIPDSRPSHEEVARIDELIGQLPPSGEIVPEQLTPLADAAPVSLDVLEQMARRREEEADQLRRLAEDVHTRNTVRSLVQLFEADQQRIDLARAVLLVAKLDDRDLDVDGYLHEIDRMAGSIRDELPDDADESQRLAALNRYLFSQHGFHGSRTDYYHRANSHLNRVIDDREGLPITLSVLYMELGRRLRIHIVGLGLPGHFMVMHMPAGGAEQVIDVFNGGVPLTREQATRKVQGMQAAARLDEHFWTAQSEKDIVRRVFYNLLGVARANRDDAGILRYLEAMVLLEPENLDLREWRARSRYQLGRRDAALADLDWLAEHLPAGPKLNDIQGLRDSITEHGR